MYILFRVAHLGGRPYSQSFIIDRVCRVDLQYNSTVCDSLDDHEDRKMEVQQMSSVIFMYKMIAEKVPGLLYSLIAGNYRILFVFSGVHFSLCSSEMFTFLSERPL